MESLKSRFLNISGNDKYQRVESPHPIPWYIGLDSASRYSLFCITENEPEPVGSTKLINVYIGKRKDSTYGITFSLKEKTALDMFAHFCEDMITYTRGVTKKEKAADYVCSRYIVWQKAFSKNRGDLLSFEQIKGLLGELCFLKMKMIPEYGQEKALNSWSGIEMTDQDFTCDDTWFEVKTTVSGSASVKISSVEQLDVDTAGHLAVLRLDKTSTGDAGRITLNSMCQFVVESFSSPLLKERFMARMLSYGYYADKGYDAFAFKYNGMTLYSVKKDFPCVRKSDLPAAAEHVKYELSLAAIDSYKEN